jgi:hypothetical protein
MKKLNENLSDIFDIEPITIEKKTETQPLAVVETGDAVINDTEFARKNIKQLIDTGNKSLEQLAAIADQSEHPRAFEVLAGLMKNLADMNKDLLELQKRKRDLAPKETASTNGLSIDKAVFVGSTAELVKMIKSNK